MTSIYLSGEYAEKNPSYHVEDSPWKAQQILKMVNKHHLQVRRVCEIGCGAGEILRQMQLRLPNETEFYGYDICPEAFALSKQRENERLHFSCEDLLSKNTEPFDLLLCIDVFEHVEDYMGFLRKLRRKAEHTIFHIPLDLSVQTVLRCLPTIVERRTSVGHLHSFLKETALLTLQDTGYEIVDWFYTPVNVERGKTPMARLARYPRIMSFRINPDLAVRILGGYSLLVLAK